MYKRQVETIWDASCRAASAEVTDGAETQGLDWFRANGFRVKPFSRLMWYLYPKLVEQGLRFEQPYQERLLRVGKELERRLHEHGITWWDKQLAEYEPLPHWRDLNGLWEDALSLIHILCQDDVELVQQLLVAGREDESRGRVPVLLVVHGPSPWFGGALDCAPLTK